MGKEADGAGRKRGERPGGDPPLQGRDAAAENRHHRRGEERPVRAQRPPAGTLCPGDHHRQCGQQRHPLRRRLDHRRERYERGYPGSRRSRTGGDTCRQYPRHRRGSRQRRYGTRGRLDLGGGQSGSTYHHPERRRPGCLLGRDSSYRRLRRKDTCRPDHRHRCNGYRRKSGGPSRQDDRGDGESAEGPEGQSRVAEGRFRRTGEGDRGTAGQEGEAERRL